MSVKNLVKCSQLVKRLTKTKRLVRPATKMKTANCSSLVSREAKLIRCFRKIILNPMMMAKLEKKRTKMMKL